MNSHIKLIKENFIQEIYKINNIKDLNDIRVKYLGKKSPIVELMSKIKDINPDEKKEFGKNVNELRDFVTQSIAQKQNELEDIELNEQIQKDKIDITLPGHDNNINIVPGYKNIITHTIDQLKKIMTLMGFSYSDGPEIETDWYNFTALNIPTSHPSRQLHDTFYVKNNNANNVNNNKDNLLLRTHTSSVQIRHMLNNAPPASLFSIGRVYRSDYDSTHTPMFHQLEGLWIDESITFAHLKSFLQKLLQLFFEIDDVPLRFRSNYFPFTEPSAEVDIKCDKNSAKNDKGIQIGVGEDWLEILGCGMIHMNVLKNMGVNFDKYQGFAFGIGIERLAMLKYNIGDLRMLYSNDIRWLKYYGVNS